MEKEIVVSNNDKKDYNSCQSYCLIDSGGSTADYNAAESLTKADAGYSASCLW